MAELREEKRHRIRESDHEGEDVAMSFNKATSRIETKLWMKWSVTIVTLLLTLVGWFSVDYVNRIKADAAEGPRAVAMIVNHQVQADNYLKQFQEMQREQKRMVRNVDRMTVFFETRFGMPAEARRRRVSPPDDSDEN